MKALKKVFVAAILLAVAVTAAAQVHKYYTPGPIWTVTMIRIASGMDQMYLQYLAGQLKKSYDAQVKAGYMKSYKILRTLGDDGEWNLLILREYPSLASIEANEEKSDALYQQTEGSDQIQMQGHQDRSKYREVVGYKLTRELMLK